MRLFVSLNLPPEIQRQISLWQKHLQKYFPPSAVRWVKPENIHLTLCFLGEVSETAEQEIISHLARVKTGKEITLTVTGLDFFPDLKRPRVFYLQVKDQENQLPTLSEKVRQECQKATALSDDKPFHPHLTLARIKTRLPRVIAPEEIWKELSPETPLVWRAPEFYLMASKLTPSGPVYTVRKTFPLK